jgi:hypothetical protein
MDTTFLEFRKKIESCMQIVMLIYPLHFKAHCNVTVFQITSVFKNELGSICALTAFS